MRTQKPKRNDKKLLWKIHHWAGLYAGILIGILSLTGALAVFIPEIDSLILKYSYEAKSSSSPTSPQIGNSIDSLTNLLPEYSSMTIRLPQEAGHRPAEQRGQRHDQHGADCQRACRRRPRISKRAAMALNGPAACNVAALTRSSPARASMI